MNKIDQLIITLQYIQQLLEQIGTSITGPSQPSLCEEKLMTRQEVKDCLGISESTYKRKVKDGTLKPIPMPGGDRFFKSQLPEVFLASQCRGNTCKFDKETCPGSIKSFVYLKDMEYAR